MKTSARRLGRGLGAFLDFGPAGEDGAARHTDTAEPASVLETSVPAARPAAVPEPPPAAPAPAPADEIAYVDDLVVGMTFPDVEME